MVLSELSKQFALPVKTIVSYLQMYLNQQTGAALDIDGIAGPNTRSALSGVVDKIGVERIVREVGVRLVEVQRMFRTNADYDRMSIPQRADYVSNLVFALYPAFPMSREGIGSVLMLESATERTAASSVSSATGIFQFTSKTWSDVISKFRLNNSAGMTGSRYDVNSQVIAFVHLTLDDIKVARLRNLISGGRLRPEHLYVLHLLGAGSGGAFLRAALGGSSEPISTLLSARVITANRNLLSAKDTAMANLDRIRSVLDLRLRKIQASRT